MGEWRETTLGEVAIVTGGGTPSSKEPTYWGGDVLWVTPGEVTKRAGRVIHSTERTISAQGLASSSAKLLPQNAVLLTSRATVGAVALAGQPMATNQGFQSLVAGPDAEPLFLMFWAQHNRDQFTSRASGSTFPEISGKKVKSIPIALPPLDEQRRIVDVVAAVDAQIEALEVEVERAGTAIAHTRAHSLEVNGAEDVRALGDIAEVKLGRMLSKERSAGDDQAPYIRNANIQWDGLDLTDLKSMSFPMHDRPKYKIKAGDILACEGGDPGRCVLMEKDLDGIFFQKAVHRVRAHSVHPEFLFEALIFAYDAGRLADLGTSTTIQHLTAEKFRTLRIHVPRPAEQVEVAARMKAMRSARDGVRAELASLRAFRATLLTALLSQSISIPESYDSFMEGVSA